MTVDKLYMNEIKIIKSIESIAPNAEAFLRITQLGDIDECVLEGNSEGFREMAIGLLKLSHGQDDSGIEELMHETSDVFITYCNKTNAPPKEDKQVHQETLTDKVFFYGFMTFLFSIPVFWLAGIIFSASWIHTNF